MEKSCCFLLHFDPKSTNLDIELPLLHQCDVGEKCELVVAIALSLSVITRETESQMIYL
jgi:hypothetical protein